MPREPIAEIIAYNRRFVGRYDVPLRLKLERLAADPFSFFRGTFHLFARDWAEATIDPPEVLLPAEGELRIVADIHGENYGTYKASDGTISYDINDFDETTWGSLNFDCCRAATSLLLAPKPIGLSAAAAQNAVRTFASSYAREIVQFAEQGIAKDAGCSDQKPPDATVVRRLLQTATAVRRADYIASITKLHNAQRKLVRGAKLFDLLPADAERGHRLLADYVGRLGDKARTEKGFYDVQDICGRIAGCGSLGRYRFAVLIDGHGDDEGKNLLLEIKESLPSGYDLCRPAPRPAAGESRAAEVESVERAMQWASNRFLGHAVDGAASFQVRAIGPREQRLDWKDVKHEDEFAQVAALHAQLLAKAHAKAALADPATRERFAQLPAGLHERPNQFAAGIADFAAAYAALVVADQRTFVEYRADVAKALNLPEAAPK